MIERKSQLSEWDLLPDLSNQEAVSILEKLAEAALGGMAVRQMGMTSGTEENRVALDAQGSMSEGVYRTLVEQLPVVTFMAQIGNDFSEIYVSPQIEAMLGYSQKEWIEDPVLWYERLHPDDKERWNIEFSRTLILDEPFRSVYRFIARDGRIVWVRGEAKIVRDERGQPRFVQGVGFDITELKQAEEATTLLAAIVESSGDAIFGKTIDGEIVSWNPAAARIYGYSQEEMIGKSFSILFPPHQTDEVLYIMELIRKGERITQYETNHLRKDGRPVDVSLTISPIKDRDGKMMGISTIARDITRRRESENQIKASLREKEVLLKEIHHRVKNNLQIIASLLNLQADRIEDEGLLETLRAGENRVISMALIHEKLYQSGNLSEIDITDYVESLAPNLLRSYGASSENIALHLEIGNVVLGIDKAIPFGLILNELICNSVKHAFLPCARGDIRIRVSAEDGNILLMVADNGIGLPPDLDFRNTSTLGMQLVNTLVYQLDGTVDLKRTGGTEFRIMFKGDG